MNSSVVDARGLSCPQPVLLTLEAIKKVGKGKLEILVDTDTAKENVIRSVTSSGWQVKEILSQGTDYKIIIHKD
ncbi:sulfurtransferase TusA family protein [Desulfothermus naphthae]